MMSSEPQLGQRRKGGMLDIGDKDSTYSPILSTIYEKAPPLCLVLHRRFFVRRIQLIRSRQRYPDLATLPKSPAAPETTEQGGDQEQGERA